MAIQPRQFLYSAAIAAGLTVGAFGIASAANTQATTTTETPPTSSTPTSAAPTPAAPTTTEAPDGQDGSANDSNEPSGDKSGSPARSVGRFVSG